MMRRWFYVGLACVAVGAWGVMVSPASASSSIRVLLASDVQRLDVSAEQILWVRDDRDQARSYQKTLRIEVRGRTLLLNGAPVAGGQVTLRAGERDLTLRLPRQAGNGRSSQSGQEKALLQVSGGIQLIQKNKGLLVVNHVDLEEYVKGVVPSEVNSSWHREMLKAQAVAARTYALYQHMLNSSREYDVAATIQDQVYKGRHGVDDRVEEAVESTRGLVGTYQNAPIYAAFSSTAAGLTEDATVVWLKDLPYLKGVECPFDLASPYYQWKTSFKVKTLEKNLRQLGFNVGTIATLTPLARSRSGRVATLRLLHSKGELILRGEELRRAVGYRVVPSTQFTIDSIGDEVMMSGYGAGHAVGLCQWGAKELAELGYPYASILLYYYPGTELRQASLTQAPPLPSVVPAPGF